MIRHYSSIISTYHLFQPSPISLLRVVLFRSVLVLILQNYKKSLMCYRLAAFRSQCHGHAYSHPLPPLWRWRLTLDLNGIERVIHLSVLEIEFREYYSRAYLPPPKFTDARGAHKRHHGFIHREFKTLIGYKNINKGRSFIFISLFSIIIFNKFLWLFPYVFTRTSHLTITLSLISIHITDNFGLAVNCGQHFKGAILPTSFVDKGPHLRRWLVFQPLSVCHLAEFLLSSPRS